MIPLSSLRRAAVERECRALRAQERGLERLAISERCADRGEAEAELARVRGLLAANEVQLGLGSGFWGYHGEGFQRL